MNLTFFTPSALDPSQEFGAASFGFVGAEDPSAANCKQSPMEIDGTILHGSYEEILAALPKGDFQAGIVLLGNAGGENEFIRTLSSRLCIPLTGGAAAFTDESGLICGGGQAAVALLRDPGYDIRVVSENIHTPLSRHTIGFTDPRQIDTIDGENALSWYTEKRKELGLSEEDFEHLTLTDPWGINAHLSVAEGRLCSGRDVEAEMELRYVAPDAVYPKMQAFYDDPSAIIFGCAGLKGILPRNLTTRGLGLFMFGEVCTIGSHSDFGNLMLSKLQIIPK